MHACYVSIVFQAAHFVTDPPFNPIKKQAEPDQYVDDKIKSEEGKEYTPGHLARVPSLSLHIMKTVTLSEQRCLSALVMGLTLLSTVSGRSWCN